MKPRSPLAGLVVAQFTNAFNDNAWKSVVFLLALREIAGGDYAGAQTTSTLVLAVFSLPLALGSFGGGALADRLSKRSVLVASKAFELALMLAATAALAIEPSGGAAALALVGLMGLQSAFFGPAKYGIVPELVPHAQLSRATGAIECSTMIAIVSGVAAGGALLEASGSSPWRAALALTGVSLLGLLASLAIPPVAPARAEGGVARTIASAVTALRAERVLALAVAGGAMFWLVAALIHQNLIVYGRAELGLGEASVGLPAAVLGLGVGLGAVLAGRFSARKVELGLLPLGSGLLALGVLSFGVARPGLGLTFVWMVALGLASGLVLVPLAALLQWRAPADRRGAVLAVANVVNYLAVLGGSVAAGWLARAELSTGGIFVAGGAAVVAGTLWALWLVPLAFARFLLVLLTHTLFRVRVVGAAHVPQEGGALLAPNHVSFADAILIAASLDRPVRFLADAGLFEKPLVGAALRWFGAIPISSSGGPRAILRALRDAGDEIQRGHLVCIFPEGQITRTGMLNPFRRGLERIVKGRSAPVIPVYLDRVWGSIFSFAEGRFFWKLPQKIPYPVGVSFGAPLEPGTPLLRVRRAVQELGERAWTARRGESLPLHRSFVAMARSRPLRLAFADASRPRVSRMRALAGAIALARALRGRWAGQERVGVLLPPSVAGALVNIAASVAGRTSVNLNYTAGRAGMESAARQASLRTLVTSRTFLERAKLELPSGVEPIWIEDVGGAIGSGARLAALALAWFAPARMLERACGAEREVLAEDVATVIFSSGSTGEPKGVMLTHANVDANVAQMSQVFRIGGGDRVLGILPFFHSFGYTATIWFAANRGLAAIYHPSPIDAPAIGALVERYAVTFLLATPTLLSIYMRRCTPAQFGSLRIVMAGAEKMPERLVTAFEDHFGVRPLEGYGATECSPVIAVSAPDFRAPGFYQPGWRRGSVGQPLPGVATRVVDPESFADLPAGETGMLLVRGPNVMLGYLGRDDLTRAAIRDGWYVTGDIAALDEDGFLEITDRLARFSKIGGEMVPHGRVEEELHAAAEASTQVFAVTGVPDERKGERLAVLTTLDLERVPELLAKLAARGLPNISIPRADAFVRVDAIPLLGTGKTDLRSVKEIALLRLGGR